MPLAVQCFRLALVYNNDHAEAYNNLGLVELQRDKHEIVKTLSLLLNLGLTLIFGLSLFFLYN